MTKPHAFSDATWPTLLTERGRLNQDLEDAIDALANLIAPPASGMRPAKLDWKKGSGAFCAKHPSGRSGKRLLTPFFRPNQSDDQSVTLSVGSYFHDAAAGYALRAPEGPDALVEASLDGGSLTISVPDGSTADGLTAVTVISKNTAGLPVSWTVLVHVVAVEGVHGPGAGLGRDHLVRSRGPRPRLGPAVAA